MYPRLTILRMPVSLMRFPPSTLACEFSCPHDMGNKCANGHNRRFGGVILALHHLCAVTKCRGRADTVLDKMSGGCTTVQAYARMRVYWRQIYETDIACVLLASAVAPECASDGIEDRRLGARDTAPQTEHLGEPTA